MYSFKLFYVVCSLSVSLTLQTENRNKNDNYGYNENRVRTKNVTWKKMIFAYTEFHCMRAHHLCDTEPARVKSN